MVLDLSMDMWNFTCIFILLIAPQFYQPFRQFGSAFHDAMNGITASSEIYAMIDKLNCIKENKANLKFDDTDMVQIELKMFIINIKIVINGQLMI